MKMPDGTVYYVEEIRTGKKTMRLLTYIGSMTREERKRKINLSKVEGLAIPHLNETFISEAAEPVCLLRDSVSS